MIAQLTGRISHIGEDSVILDVQGVGYQVFCDAGTLHQLPGSGEVTTLVTELVVREDMLRLYGFREQASRDWFELLQKIPGVGAKVALALLSACQVPGLLRAVATQDKTLLTQANGVGAKLAMRILAELKDKRASLPTLDGIETGTSSPKISSSSDDSKERPDQTKSSMTVTDDAIEALVGLGYGRAEAFDAVHMESENADDVSALIKAALKRLSSHL